LFNDRRLCSLSNLKNIAIFYIKNSEHFLRNNLFGYYILKKAEDENSPVFWFSLYIDLKVSDAVSRANWSIVDDRDVWDL